MTAPLIVSDGTAVATDELLAAADAADHAVREADWAVGELRRLAAAIDVARVWGAGGQPARLAGARFDAAAALADSGLPRGRALANALGLAADGYGLAERMVQALADGLGGPVAASAGRLVPLGALALLHPGAIAAALATWGAFSGIAALPGGEEAIEGGPGARALFAMLSSPAFVAAVRQAVMLADEAVLGAVGVPVPLVLLLGDAGLGLSGLDSTAAVVAAIASVAGLLRETPVRLAEARVSRPRLPLPPDGWRARLDRVPRPRQDDGVQVRIEEYTMPDGSSRYEVYVAGTATFDPVPTTEPWDMTSNVANAAAGGSGAVAAVVDAMRSAGIGPADPVQLTGYSQGGAAVARIAESREFAVAGLASFGGNTGQIAIPTEIPTVIVEHTDDLVPALGGRQDNAHAVLVRREAYAGETVPVGEGVPAHRRPRYLRTAAMMDDAASAALAGASASFAGFAAGAVSMTRTDSRFERVSGSGPRA